MTEPSRKQVIHTTGQLSRQYGLAKGGSSFPEKDQVILPRFGYQT